MGVYLASLCPPQALIHDLYSLPRVLSAPKCKSEARLMLPAPKCKNKVCNLSTRMKHPPKRGSNKSIYILTRICAGVYSFE